MAGFGHVGTISGQIDVMGIGSSCLKSFDNGSFELVSTSQAVRTFLDGNDEGGKLATIYRAPGEQVRGTDRQTASETVVCSGRGK